jgi:hypothetical protein
MKHHSSDLLEVLKICDEGMVWHREIQRKGKEIQFANDIGAKLPPVRP